MKIQVTLIHEGATYFGEAELHLTRGKKGRVTPSRSDGGPRQIVSKPSKAVDLLYRSGFFKTSRRLRDVSNELRNQGYDFSRPSILMALKAAEFLTLKGKRGSYGFVQRFPPQA